MEFDDQPNFTVAGVTDWNNTGIHGSDASQRTSEALVKETLALKSGGPAETSASASNAGITPVNSSETEEELREAREHAKKMLAIADKADVRRLLGELDERLGDPLEAVQEYERAARLDPSEQNYFAWGSELLLHRADQPAAEVFTKASSAHPDSARLLAGLGAALFAGGFYDEAARRLCEASDLKPADPTPYLFLGRMEKAAPASLSCAEQKLARFVRDQPGSALANYYYGMTLWKRDQGSENQAGLQQAEALLEKAVTIDPKLGEAYLQLGILYYSRNSFEQAIRAYKKAIEASPRVGEAYYRLGLAYRRIGEESKAEQEFQMYEKVEKTETATIERQRRELRQFLIILNDQPAASSPR
jgi:tetratricopeptide (TPR) repeat protein